MLAHRIPSHHHRNCTPRRQLISVCDGVGDQPRIVVSLMVRAPGAVVAAMRDVEEGRHDTALRCLQDRTLSVAAGEGTNHSL